VTSVAVLSVVPICVVMLFGGLSLMEMLAQIAGHDDIETWVDAVSPPGGSEAAIVLGFGLTALFTGVATGLVARLRRWWLLVPAGAALLVSTPGFMVFWSLDSSPTEGTGGWVQLSLAVDPQTQGGTRGRPTSTSRPPPGARQAPCSTRTVARALGGFPRCR
jgi:hypothetical protein